MDNNVRFSNLLEDVRHFVWSAAAGVGVLFTREFSAGDKLSRQFGATVARLIGSIDASGRRSRRVIVVTIRCRDESTGRGAVVWSVQNVRHDVQL